MKEKQLRVYLIWAFAIAWLVQGVAAWLFWQGQVAAYQLPLMVSMRGYFLPQGHSPGMIRERSCVL